MWLGHMAESEIPVAIVDRQRCADVPSSTADVEPALLTEGLRVREPRRPAGQISAITVASSRLKPLPATVGHTSGNVRMSRSISSWRAVR